jgi:hairy and enhancer of split, invertebrate
LTVEKLRALFIENKMAPIYPSETRFAEEDSMSRTDQYRKVMKPLLERKRRARINACLDELKDLMVYALQAEGESISKLEKADVLELTVRHLQKLKRQQMLALNPTVDLDRFHAGYTACATEVSKCLASTGVDIAVGSRLMSHLGHKLHTIETARVSPLQVKVPLSPASDCGYSSGRDSTPSPSSTPGLLQISPKIEQQQQHSPVWRPF